MKTLMLTLFAAAALSPAIAGAQTGPMALGLTHHQLEDADLVDARGKEIGEIERVVMDASGKINGLIVELDQRDPKPDRHVKIPLTGLKAVPEARDPGDFNVQTTQTLAALLALPEASLAGS